MSNIKNLIVDDNSEKAAKTAGNSWNIAQYVNVEAGETYTMTCFAKLETERIGAKLRFQPDLLKPSYFNFDKNLTTNYQKFTCTWTCEVGGIERIHIRTASEADVLYVKKIKFEKGNKATDWTPAPEDVDNNVKDSIDNLEIGGRNLLLDSSFTDVNKWFLHGADYPENVALTHSADGGKMEVIETRDNPLSAYFFVNLGNNYAQLSTEFRKHIQGGVWLTISGDVKINFDTDGQDILSFDFRPIDNYAIKRYVRAYFPQNMPKNTWVRIKGSAYVDEITDVTIGKNLLSIQLISDASRTVGSVVEYRNIKLEIGNKATDWTPAPEDVDAGIANAKETADSIASNIYVPDSTLLDGSKISDGSLSINQMDDTVAGTYSDPTTKKGIMEWNGDALHIKSIDVNAQNTYETVIGGDGIKFNWNGAQTASINQDELRINKTVVINAMEVGNWSWAIHPTTGNLMVKWNGGDS